MTVGSTTSQVSARFLSPDLMERGIVNTLTCPLWQGGVLQAPTAGTITIYDDSNAKQENAAVVTITDKIATFPYTPAASLAYAEHWRVEWSLTRGGVPKVYPNDAALVRTVLRPVVTDQDLFRRHRALDPTAENPLSTVSNYQDFIDEAWAVIELRLIAAGNRVNLIMSPSSFRKVHLDLTLALVFDDFSTSLNAVYADRAERLYRQYEAAWADLNFLYAAADDADNPGGTGKRKAASPTIWLTGRG